ADGLAVLAPLESLRQVLAGFEPRVHEVLAAQLLARLGLRSRDADEDGALVAATFAYLHESPVGVDRFFFDWYGGEMSATRAANGPAGSHYAGAAFDVWRRRVAQ